MTSTPNLNLIMLQQHQAEKEVAVNEALMTIDALLLKGVVSKNFSSPPSGFATGDLYIIKTFGQNEWSGFDNHIAYFDQVWRFIAPRKDMVLWVREENYFFNFNGSEWARDEFDLNNISSIGINSTSDNTNRLSVASDAALFSHNGAGTQLKLNKNSESDTASLLFQSSWKTHAEMGLIGNNNMDFKVSADGSNFQSSFHINSNTGNVQFNKFIGFGAPELAVISSGEITITSSYVMVDTENGDASDELEIINGGNDGDIVILKSANDSRTVIVKDYGSQTQTPNIQISGDFELNRTRDRIILQKDDGWWRLLCEASS